MPCAVHADFYNCPADDPMAHCARFFYGENQQGWSEALDGASQQPPSSASQQPPTQPPSSLPAASQAAPRPMPTLHIRALQAPCCKAETVGESLPAAARVSRGALLARSSLQDARFLGHALPGPMASYWPARCDCAACDRGLCAAWPDGLILTCLL